ncbi:aryl-alcohol oxidase-like protein [Epithele typhae]|uniref:aryl-alcohol oxidase-like protein n=1 Tax=Epithele typhae TaxID=378194 RepID=UPI002007CE66|nr:aryl-alcohol oxidase-like protein [Epithele typhae]KAH9945030.1 aryl-alcohol oxidase-like protein [Epithele typhae]
MFIASSILAAIPLLWSTTLAISAILTNHHHAANRKYDFVIIGGGTAGSVIAHRLTEDPNVRVLLVEAGRSNVDGPDVDDIQVPFLVSSIDASFNWNYSTVAQPSLQNRSLDYPRGHVLGGSSSINFMLYTRGSSDEYDRVANITGDEGWSWKHMLPYMIKSETLSPPVDGHDTRSQVNATLHGFHGPVLTSLPGNSTILDGRVIMTTSELAEFPFNLDMNSGNPLGLGWLQSTIGHGVRTSSATAFLDANTLDRKNLDVLIGTRVTRLISSVRSNSKPTFRDVELAQSPSGERVIVTATKELVLSAGSVGTPQILKLSGIGDREELAAHGIPLVLDLPDVGKNLQDHPWVPLQWQINTNVTLDPFNRNATLRDAALSAYDATKRGPLANNPGGNHIGWFRLPENSSVLRQYGDPSSGPLSPHYELTVSNSFLSFTQPTPDAGGFMSMAAALVAPTSKGSVSLASSSAFDAPLIDPAFLQAPEDLAILTEAVMAAHRFTSAPAWKDFIIAPFPDTANTTTEEGAREYVKRMATTFRHPVGTARMGAADDASGVVGPDLCVKGAAGLRIVDASVFPHIFGSHLQAPVYAIAERAADLIKQAHGLRRSL